MSSAISVSYFGLPGSYSHEAALRRFGRRQHLPELVSRRTVADVFEALRRGESRCGVVPIENSLGGPIPETVDQLVRDDFLGSGLCVCEELALSVKLSLLGHRGRTPRRIYSHFAPLRNVGGWLRARFAGVEIIEVESTAAAAARAAEERDGAAVASAGAAGIYHLDVIESVLPNSGENITQFFVIGTKPQAVRVNGRTAVVFGLKHEPGSLVNALNVLAKQRLNVTRVVSRAKSEDPNQYVFLVEFEGHLGERRTKAAYEKLLKCTQFVRVLGSFPVRKEFA